MLIAALLFVSLAVQAQTLVGHWLIGDGSLADKSGYQPAGTHDGYADGNAGNLGWSTDVPTGFTGDSLNLAAGGVGVRISNSTTSDANYQNTFDDQLVNGFTVAFWAKGFPDVWSPFVAKDGESQGFQVRRFSTSGNETFTIRGTGSGNADPSGSANINDGHWHHFAAVYDGGAGTRQVYVDGVLDTAINLTGDGGPMANPSASPLGLGERYANGGGPGAFFSGMLYDVRIYSGALSSAAVAALLNPPGNSYAVITPGSSTLNQGATNQLAVNLSLATTSSQPITVYITNSNPALLQLVGENVNGVLTLVFPVGNTSQSIAVIGVASGTVTLNAAGTGLVTTTATIKVVPVYGPSLVGHWITGDESLADTSGFQPAGTHDGVADDNNTGVVAFSSDVPAGFLGESLDLSSGNTAVRINNTKIGDAGYTNTFDDVLANHLTVTCWEKFQVNNNWNTFVSKNGESSGFMTRRLAVSDNETFTLVGTTSHNNNPGGTAIVDDGNWHFIAAVWDGVAGTRKVYVDGVLDIDLANDFGPWISPAQHSLMLGARDDNGAFNYLNGLLYDVRIYNYALSQSQVISLGTPVGPPTVSNPGNQETYPGQTAKFTVAAIGNPLPNIQWYKNGTTVIAGATNATLTLLNVQNADATAVYSAQVSNPLGTNVSAAATLTLVGLPSVGTYPALVLANSPMGYWRFSSGGGKNAFDYVGGNTAVDALGSPLQAGPQSPAFPGFETTNSAPFMDGISQGYVSTVSLFNNLSNFTLMGWFNIDQLPFSAPDGRASLFGQQYTAEFGFYNGGTLYFYSKGLTGDIETTTGFTANQWNFVAAVSDTTANTMTVYLNGVVIGTTLTASAGTVQPYLFSIGKNVADFPNSAFFPGSLDEVAAFDHALPASTIQALYQASLNLSFTLNIASQGGGVKVNWPVGHLESAPTVAGPWTTVAGAVSPYSVPPNTTSRFYRAANP